jgi:hypothetical protein
MTATKDSNRSGRRADRGKSVGRRAADPESLPQDAAAAAATEPRPARERRADTARVPKPLAVKSGRAATRIGEIAEVADALETRRRLRRLARQVADGPTSVRKLAFIEMAIAECLEQSDQAAGVHDPWLLREAAGWALAWLARSRRAGGSSGGLLEQFVRRAGSGATALEARDTLPAAFVLTLSRLFCDIDACRRLERGVAAALDEEIGRLVSDAGSVGLTGTPAMVERICRWARCRRIAAETGDLPWGDASEAKFAAAVAVGLRVLGDRGRMLVAAGRMPQVFSAPLLDAARDARSRGRVRRTAAALAAGRPGKGLLARDHDDPEAAVAILRSGWGPEAVRVLVDYRDVAPRLELSVGDRLLLDGPWGWSLARDGQPLEAEGPWASTCLQTNDDATYFEIVAPVTGGLQLERSVTILAKDRVVVLADAITRTDAAAAAGGLLHAATVPVADGLDVEPAEETREVFLYDTEMRCVAMPLGLPEWSVAGRGSFRPTPAGLVLEQEGQGRLFAPVWLDCQPGRIGGQLTWRQLTVADTRINLPPSMAAGHRVQVGLEQWLLYRALDAPRNRTLLGCNVSCESLIGRIDPEGIVRRAIEIE